MTSKETVQTFFTRIWNMFIYEDFCMFWKCCPFVAKCRAMTLHQNVYPGKCGRIWTNGTSSPVQCLNQQPKWYCQCAGAFVNVSKHLQFGWLNPSCWLSPNCYVHSGPSSGRQRSHVSLVPEKIKPKKLMVLIVLLPYSKMWGAYLQSGGLPPSWQCSTTCRWEPEHMARAPWEPN